MMKSGTSHYIARWVCLPAYLLMAVTMSHAMVLCEGADGHIAVERATALSPLASSLKECSVSDEGVMPPCKDTLISAGQHHLMQKQWGRARLIQTVPVVVMSSFTLDHLLASEAVRAFELSLVADHAALVLLRTVVLLI